MKNLRSVSHIYLNILLAAAFIFLAVHARAQEFGDMMKVDDNMIQTFYSSGTFIPPAGVTELGAPVVAGGSGHITESGDSGIVPCQTLTSIAIFGDISLNIGEAISSAGQGAVEDVDNTSTLSWSSSVEDPALNKITVRIRIGSLPQGLELRVNPSGASGVILSGTPQDFITDIGNESRTEPLTYRLAVTDVQQLFATVEPITIEYTISPQ
jgi:uncharacterized protein (DUF2147 family)